jgi:hypothetical protein
MKNNLDRNIETSTNGQPLLEECTDSVQAGNAWQYLAKHFRQSGSWVTGRLQAHNKMVSSLGVYRRNRVDINNTQDNDG